MKQAYSHQVNRLLARGLQQLTSCAQQFDPQPKSVHVIQRGDDQTQSCPVESLGLKLSQQMAKSVAQEIGDMTTTALLIANNIVQAVHQHLNHKEQQALCQANVKATPHLVRSKFFKRTGSHFACKLSQTYQPYYPTTNKCPH